MGLNLTPADFEMFARFGVSSDLLERAGVHRVTDAEARRELGITPDRPGDMAGIIFPYLDPVDGHCATRRLRREHPDIGEDGKVKDKYLCPYGDNRHLYFPPGAAALLSDISVPAVFAEAEKSALAITALVEKSGRKMLAIATGGCWGWRGKTGIESGPNGEREEIRGPLPDFGLITWKERRVYIAFDSNVVSNPNVWQARQALAETLAGWGAIVLFVVLPEAEGNGPDDLIALRGERAFLGLLDTAEEYRTTIVLHAGRHPEAVDEAEEVLLRQAESLCIFQRGEELVRIIQLESEQRSGGIRRKAGTIKYHADSRTNS